MPFAKFEVHNDVRAEIIIPGGDVSGINNDHTHQLFIRICYKKGGSTDFTDDQRVGLSFFRISWKKA